jgi:antitoxin HigA-1
LCCGARRRALTRAAAVARKDAAEAWRPLPQRASSIRDEIVEANALTVGQAAEHLGVARPTLSHLLNGKADLSAEMALRIEQVFGIRMKTLLAMQAAYDEVRVRQQVPKLRLKPFKRAIAGA